MRPVTLCPACQTEFFVTEEQLNQHQGQVRCGQCLHIFNAQEQFIHPDTLIESNINLIIDPDSNEPIADQKNSSTTLTHPEDKPYNFEDELKVAMVGKESAPSKLKPLFALVLILFLLITALGQIVYFLRHDIASSFPQIKPFLVKACTHFGCNIDLPRKIEFIIIDDSDMQEDDTYVGLMHLSSTLMNKAPFDQAYPNIEVTLTDVNDKSKLRRIFKPHEYLPKPNHIENGIQAGQELKINLALTTQNVTVAGYRVLVNY